MSSEIDVMISARSLELLQVPIAGTYKTRGPPPSEQKSFSDSRLLIFRKGDSVRWVKMTTLTVADSVRQGYEAVRADADPTNWYISRR